MSHEAYVHIRDLRVEFRRDGQTVNAVNGVSFDVQKGEVMALIGESGSGKSVTLRALMRLHPPKSSVLSGTLKVGEEEVLTMSAGQLRRYRGARCAMIFQEPLLAFDPVYTVGQQIVEGLRRHEGLSRQAARERALEALRQVRIPSPERRLDAYPHEMSGGMRHGANPDPDPAARAAKAARSVDYICDPRYWRGGGDRRPGGGDVRRAHRRRGVD